MAGLSTSLVMVTNLHTSYTKQLYISRVRFLDLPPNPSSKNLALCECLSVETHEWTVQAKAEVAYQLGNVNVKSIDPLLQLAASPEEMWNIVAEICQGRAGGNNPLKPPTSITPFKCLQDLSIFLLHGLQTFLQYPTN